jgi:hypothetical protein
MNLWEVSGVDIYDGTPVRLIVTDMSTEEASEELLRMVDYFDIEEDELKDDMLDDIEIKEYKLITNLEERLLSDRLSRKLMNDEHRN